MAVPTHFKITARGVFDGTPEQWSFGFHMARQVDTGPDAGYSDIDQAAVDAAFDFLFTGGTPISDTRVKMVDWRAYVIGTDGKTEGNPIRREFDSSPPQGTATPRHVPQVSLAITLVADNRGPARLGRFYIPGPGFAMGSDSRLSEANASAAAEQITLFLKQVSDAIDAPGTPESVAAVNVSSRGDVGGTIQAVDHVEVGHVFDTLRTRRTSLLEERHVHGQIDW